MICLRRRVRRAAEKGKKKHGNKPKEEGVKEGFGYADGRRGGRKKGVKKREIKVPGLGKVTPKQSLVNNPGGQRTIVFCGRTKRRKEENAQGETIKNGRGEEKRKRGRTAERRGCI